MNLAVINHISSFYTANRRNTFWFYKVTLINMEFVVRHNTSFFADLIQKFTFIRKHSNKKVFNFHTKQLLLAVRSPKFISLIFKTSLPASHKTGYSATSNVNHLTKCMEIFAVRITETQNRSVSKMQRYTDLKQTVLPVTNCLKGINSHQGTQSSVT